MLILVLVLELRLFFLVWGFEGFEMMVVGVVEVVFV